MKRFFAWCTGVFLLITVITVQYNAASDGWTRYGFPETFYTYTSGKMEPGTIRASGLIWKGIRLDTSLLPPPGMPASA